MAGIPAVNLTDTNPGMSVADLRQQLEPELTTTDRKLLFLLFLRHDCDNVVRLLKHPSATIIYDGNYDAEQYEELFADAQSIDLGTSSYPQFLLDFIRAYAQNAERKDWFAEDDMLLRYYEYCIAESHDDFVRSWFQLNLDVTNILTALIARQQGWKISEYVKGSNEVAEMICTNDARDFNLGTVRDFMPEIMKIVDEKDPVEKERKLDAFKWLWLDEQTFADTFSIEAVFAYLCKLEIQERWAQLDAEQGRATFEQIINDLRSEAQVPAEFIKK